MPGKLANGRESSIVTKNQPLSSVLGSSSDNTHNRDAAAMAPISASRTKVR